MTQTETSIQRLRIGDYLAEVTVVFNYREGKDYTRTLSVEDALKVERVAKALERGDLATAAKESKLFRLEPVHVTDAA